MGQIASFQRLRIQLSDHSVTKHSPFELVYGIKPNEFVNYKNNKESSDKENLMNRSLQLKRLVDKISGMAYKCTTTINKIILTETLFGENIHQ